jgi:hypothetical protein
MKIYYIYPDYLEDWYEETQSNPFVSEDLCRKFVREGKADVYGATTFEDAFNNDHISDMGIIKIFTNSKPNF